MGSGEGRVASEPSNLSSKLGASEWGEKESFYSKELWAV